MRQVKRISRSIYKSGEESRKRKLINRFVKTFTDENDLVIDDFNGSGTTAEACIINNRKYIGFEIHPDYIEMTKQRLLKYDGGLFF